MTTLKPGVASGEASGCPFCLARRRPPPKLGQRVRVFTDYGAVFTGEVVPLPESLKGKLREVIAVHIDTEPAEDSHLVYLRQALVEILPPVPMPLWAPPLSLQDTAELERFVIDFCCESYRGHVWKASWSAFYYLTVRVWRRRFPITGEELWAVLQAHSIPARLHKRLVQLFHDGREILICAEGRKPIKKNRVPRIKTLTRGQGASKPRQPIRGRMATERRNQPNKVCSEPALAGTPKAF